MLLYHPIRKTYDDFNEAHRYVLHGNGGTEIIETDKELREGQIIILQHISTFAIKVDRIWEQTGEKHFSHSSAEEYIVRGRTKIYDQS